MIELIDDYVILVDDYCYTLAKKKQTVDKRTGKTKLAYIGYFGTVEGALTALAKQLAKDKLKDAHTDLAGAVDAIRESNDEVKKLLENLT